MTTLGKRSVLTLEQKIDPETTEKIEQFLVKLEACAKGETIPFTIIVDDPSGNSFLENPYGIVVNPELIEIQVLSKRRSQHEEHFI